VLLACAAAIGFVLVVYAGGTLGLVALGALVAAPVIISAPMVGLALTILAQVITPFIGGLGFSDLVTLTRPLGALTLVGWFVWSRRRRIALTFSPQMVPLLLFLLAVLLSIAVMPDREQSLVGFYRLAAVLILYFLVANLAVDRRRLLAVTAIVLALGTLSSLIAVVQYVVPGYAVVVEENPDLVLDAGEGAIVDPDSLRSGPIKRVTGGVGAAGTLAHLLVSVVPLTLFWWRHAPSAATRALAPVLAGLLLVALVLTFTRAGILALGVSVVYLVATRRLPLLPLLGLAPVALVVVALLAPEGFVERMISLDYLREGSTPYRQDLILCAWDLIKEAPLLGWGFGQFGVQFLTRVDTDWVRGLAKMVPPGHPEIHNIMPHNLAAEITVEYGLLGFLPLAAFFVWMVKDLAPARRSADPWESDLATCLIAGIIGFQVSGLLVHGKLFKILWILAGMTAALRRVVLTDGDASRIEAAPTAADERDGRTAA
jgi:hypothetical protein